MVDLMIFIFLAGTGTPALGEIYIIKFSIDNLLGLTGRQSKSYLSLSLSSSSSTTSAATATTEHMKPGGGTFANWRNSGRYIGESTVDFRQLAKVRWTLPVVTKQYQYRIYVRAHVNVIGIGIS
jgi:hypothetical protein